MKRAFPQNPQSVSNSFPSIPMDGMEQDPSGNNCRFKTSAAVLGLALSVGASGTFLARPGEALGTVIPKDALALASATSSDQFSGAISGSSVGANLFHTVAPGETVWEIARAHQVDVQDIKSANGIAPGEVLKVGQVLRVPAEPQAAPVKPVVRSSSTIAAAPAESTAAEASEVFANEDNQRTLASNDLEIAEPQNLDSLPGENGSQTEALSSAAPLSLPLRPELPQASPSFPAVGLEAIPELPSASAPASDWADQAVLSTPEARVDTSVDSSFEPDLASTPATTVEGVESQAEINAQLGDQKPQQLAAITPATSTVEEPSALADDLPAAPSLYQVRPGDSVWAIASAHGVSPEKLLQHNPELSNPNMIRAGQTLRLPTLSAIAVQQPTAVTNEPRALEQPESGDYIARIRQAASNPVDREQLYAWIQSVQQRTAPVAVTEPTPEPAEAEISLEQKAPVVAASAEAAPEAQDPHVASLVSEVRQLQQQQPVEVAALTAPAAAPSQTVPEGAPVNPEFSPEFDEDAEAAAQRQRLMAAAPLSSEAYMPRPVVPVGQTVSPDLPILPQPSEFLPEAPNRFDGYIWPTQGVLTSGYGWRWGRMHHGVDVAGPVGTPIFAAASGVVVRAGWNSGGYGNLVDIRHPDGSLTRYAHNSRLNVRQGQEVRQGQQIAEMGSTGYSTGPHLHFEIHMPNSGTVNPMAYLPSR